VGPCLETFCRSSEGALFIRTETHLYRNLNKQ